MTIGSLPKDSQSVDWIPNEPFLNLKSTRRQLQLWMSRQFVNVSYLEGIKELNPVKRCLRNFNVKVMMGEYLTASLPWLQISKDLGIGFFAHAHGYDVSARLRQQKWRREYLRYNGAAGIITMSQFSKKRLIEIGLLPEKIHVVPYGVDVPAKPYRRAVSKTTHCLAVGRMVTKKAPLKTLEAFRMVAEQHQDLRLNIVGEGELLPEARRFAQQDRPVRRLRGGTRPPGVRGSVARRSRGHPDGRCRAADGRLVDHRGDPDSGDGPAAGGTLPVTRHHGRT